jgi:hypothetical protein
LEAKVIRLLALAHPSSLNVHYLRHRLCMQASPREAAESLVVRGLAERVNEDPGEWRATRKGVSMAEVLERELGTKRQ